MLLDELIMLLDELIKKNLITPPSFVVSNCAYLCLMGSHAYGTANTSDKTKKSDFDIYGFCIPPKEIVFPVNEIIGFGRQKKRFEQFQASHIFDKEKDREYDLTVFNIAKYFTLVMENNPNCIDSLFVPQECILHITQVGNMVRENRKIFLHKGCFDRFKNYSFSQLHKMTTKNPQGKRKELREQYGFDVKFGLNVVRLLQECEMILTEGDLDLRRGNEYLKAIRRGEVSEEEIRKWASEKELQLEKLHNDSKLPYGPDENKIKTLLLNCLEHHYGNLSNVITMPDRYKSTLIDIKTLLDKINII